MSPCDDVARLSGIMVSGRSGGSALFFGVSWSPSGIWIDDVGPRLSSLMDSPFHWGGVFPSIANIPSIIVIKL